MTFLVAAHLVSSSYLAQAQEVAVLVPGPQGHQVRHKSLEGWVYSPNQPGEICLVLAENKAGQEKRCLIGPYPAPLEKIFNAIDEVRRLAWSGLGGGGIISLSFDPNLNSSQAATIVMDSRDFKDLMNRFRALSILGGLIEPPRQCYQLPTIDAFTYCDLNN